MTNHSFSININAFGLCCLLDLFIDFYIKKIFTFSIFLSKQQLCLFKKKKKFFRLKKLYIWIHTFGHWSSEKTHYCCTMFKWLFKTFQEYHRVQLNRFSFAWNCFRKLDEKCRNVPRFLIDFVMLPFFIFGSFSNSFIPFYFSR